MSPFVIVGGAWLSGCAMLLGYFLLLEWWDRRRERRLVERLERLLELPSARDPEILA